MEAERARCDITVVHALRGTPSRSSVYGQGADPTARSSAHDVLSEAARCLHEAGSTRPVHRLLRLGDPVEVLEVESHGARLMVVGADRRQPWHVRVSGGEVTSHLARHAACPLVVVPEDWKAWLHPTAVVLVLEDDGWDPGPLAFAVRTASQRRVPVQVLLVANDDEPRSRTQRALVAGWASCFPDVELTCRVVKGTLVDEASSAMAGAGLLVLPRPRGRRFLSALPDAQAHRMLAGARCPVVVVPPATDVPGRAGEDLGPWSTGPSRSTMDA